MIRSYSNDELIKLMDATPLPVQQAIESKATVAVVLGIGTRLSLHIDQIGKVAELNVLMLLGLINPEEFLQEIVAAGIPDKDARTIMTEINQKIFVPLREQLRKGPAATGMSEEVSAASKAPAMSTPLAPLNRKPEIPGVKPEAGPAGPSSYFHLQNKLAAPSAPAVGEKQVPKLVVPSRPTEAPQSARPALRDALAAITGAPKQMESRKLLEDHEEPHIEFRKVPPPVAPRTPPLPNLPGTVPPHPIPAGARYAPPAVPEVQPPAPPVKSYAADPYREPVE